MTPDDRRPRDPDGVAVEVRGVSKRYGRRGRTVVVLDDVDLELRAGRATALIGPNGAGKSTLLRVVAGLTLADAGAVRVFGCTVPHEAPQVVGRLGCALDAVGVLPGLTGRANLEATARRRGLGARDVDDAIERCGLSQQQARRPVRGYSLGMRQRLVVAVALLGDPDLLLLDEPSNGLDPGGVTWLRRLVVEMVEQRGCTVVVASHHLAELERMCTDVVALAGGKVVHASTVADHLAERRIAHRVATTASTEVTLAVLARCHPLGATRLDEGDAIVDLSPGEVGALTLEFARLGIGVTHLAPHGAVLQDLLADG